MRKFDRLNAFLIVLSLFCASPGRVAGADDPLAHIKDPKVRAAITKGVQYVKSNLGLATSGASSLVAYTLIKAGEPANSQTVASLLKKIEQKVKNGKYRPTEHHRYEAGVDLMALESADPKRYLPQMKAIADYLIATQLSGGDWDYEFQQDGGDTSISQYALLGLWAAKRAGISIPPKVWDGAAGWHVQTQTKSGGFAYHPRGNERNSKHSITVAGIASQCIARMYLYPNWKSGKSAKKTRKKKASGKTLGVLETVDFSTGVKDPSKQEKKKPVEDPDYKPKTSIAAIGGSIGRGVNWLTARFTIGSATGFKLYYIYGLERCCALAELDRVGNRDWYAEGCAWLVKEQDEKGSWSDMSGRLPATCFGLLFLTRSTAQILGKPLKPAVDAGAGLLAGGRGLPDNLSAAEMKDGKIKGKKLDTPLDQLLAELANPKLLGIETAQEAIVEKIQLGDREKLIGQKDKLLKLVKSRQDEVRRTAMWALGRCEDLTIAPLLVQALKDGNLDVAVEARNALCTLSRRPRGFGLPSTPTNSESESLSEPARAKAIEKWKDEAYRRWHRWYLRIRPYKDRDDLIEFKLKR